MQVNMHEAKTQLSKLVARVEAGEEIVIARAGRPVAKLVPAERSGQRRGLGDWKGRVWMAPDFDAEDPELIALFEDGPIEP